MDKGEFVKKVRAKHPAYKNIEDDELFIRLAKHYPTYIVNDEDLKGEFLELANQNEEYGAGFSKLTPEKTYGLISSIPEYKPPESEFELFKKHDPDVDWGEVGGEAVSHITNMVKKGFGWDYDANMGWTAVEGFAQGTRALIGIASQSTDPNSLFFKGKKLIKEASDPSGDPSGYKQWLAARDFAHTSLRLEEGEEQLLPDSFKVNRPAAAAIGVVADISLPVSFGGTTIGKMAARGTGAALRGAGKASKTVGKAVSMPMEAAADAASKAIAKATPGIPEGAVKGTAVAATGIGATVSPVAAAATTTYVGAKGAEAVGDILTGIGEQVGKQPTRLGVFAGIAADPTKSKLTRGISRTASVLGGDTVLTAAGAASRGAVEGGVVGMGLGYGTAREQGAAGGLYGGAAFGVVGGTAGTAFRKLTGGQRRAAIKADFGRFVEGIKKEVGEADAIAVQEWIGKDVEKAASVMDLYALAKGVSGEDIGVRFLNNDAFLKETGGQQARGAEYVKGDKSEILINTAWRGKGSRSMAHEVFHALGRLDGMKGYKGRLRDAFLGVEGSGGEIIRPGLLTEKELRSLAAQYAKNLSNERVIRGADLTPAEKAEAIRNGTLALESLSKGSEAFRRSVDEQGAAAQKKGAEAYEGFLVDMFGQTEGLGKWSDTLRALNAKEGRGHREVGPSYRSQWLENWKDNTIEELSAEAFASLIDGSKPDSLLAGKGFDTITRRALDSLILAEAQSGFGRIRNGLTKAFGIEFDAVGNPKGSTIFEDKDGNPLTHRSAEVNAILRDMVRAKRAVTDFHAIDNKKGLVSKNVVRTRGLSKGEMIKFKDQFNETPMAELFTVDKKGNVKMVKGAEAAHIEAETASKVVDALETVADSGDAAHVRKQVKEDGTVEYVGSRFSDEQVAAINKADIHPRIKEFINLMHESLGDGRMFDTEYWAATRRGKKGEPIYASLKSTRRNVVPYTINISKQGNFYARALDITALDKKFRQWKNKNTEWLRHWDNPDAFYEDAMKYLQNLASGDAVPSSKLFGETKRNILNEFIGARGRAGLNPLALEKMAEKEFLIRSFRLDRIASMNLDNGIKRFPFSEEVYKLNQVNFYPESVAPRNLVQGLISGQPGSVAPEHVVINKSNMQFLPDLIDQKYVDGKALEGKKVFFMNADRMKTGVYKSRSGTEHELRGGSDHPDLIDNLGIVAWAVEGGPIAKQLERGIDQTDGIGLVTLMSEESVKGNITFADIMIDEVGFDLANNKQYKKDFKQRLAAANVAARKAAVGLRLTALKERNKKLPVKKRASAEALKAKAAKDVGNKKIIRSFDHLKEVYKNLSFEIRGEIWKQLAPDINRQGNYKGNPAIYWKDVMNGVIDRTDAEGWRLGDITKVIQFDKKNPIATYEETGTPPHPAYQHPVKGHSLGNVKGRVNVMDLLGPALDSVRKGKYALKDAFPHKSVSAFLRTNQLTNPEIQPTLTSESLNAATYTDMLRFKTKARVPKESFGPKGKPKGYKDPNAGATPERVFAELEKRRKINEELGGKYKKGFAFLPEKAGPELEQLGVALQEGAISRQQWDAAVELMNPAAKRIQTPTDEAVDFSGNRERMIAALTGSKGDWKKKIEMLGGQLSLADGSPVGLRIDIPAYLKSLELVQQGLLEEPVYIITFHAGTTAKNKAKGSLGSAVGYDIIGRATDVTFNISSQVAAVKIQTGEKPKTTMATAEGKISHDRTIPDDINTNYIQVGMNPKRHGYFYDRATGRAVKSAGEVISFGSTVFAKKGDNLKFYTEAERLSLFSYLPEKLGESEVRTTEDGYKAYTRKGRTRVYTPVGKLVGVASSAKIANQLYRRHRKQNEPRENNLRQ